MRISDWSSDVCSSDLEGPIGIGLDTGLACTVFPETRIAEPGEAVETGGPEQGGEREAVAEQPRSGGRPEVASEIGNQLLRLRDGGEHMRLVEDERGGGFLLHNLVDRKSTSLNSSHYTAQRRP